MRLRSILFPLVFASILFISSIIALEVLIRFLYPEYNPSGEIYFMHKGADLYLAPANKEMKQWKNTGDYNVSVRINSNGFRDKNEIKNFNENDWVVVGDSFSFGWGVEENERYSNKLAVNSQKTLYNISIPTHIKGYFALLSYAQSLTNKPIKNVILGLCIENDLKNYENWIPSTPHNQKASFNFEFINIKSLLRDNLAIYNAFTTIFHSSPKLKSLAIKYGLIKNNIEGMNQNILDFKILESTVSLLSSLNKQYHLIILVIPSRGLWAGENQKSERLIHENLINKLKTARIKFVDMKEVFESKGNPLDFHFKFDGHWNKRGHELAADELALILK